MGLISKEQDIAGKWRVVWESNQTGNFYTFKFQANPTDQQIRELSDQADEEQQEAATAVKLDFGHDAIIKQAMIDLVRALRAAPTLTLTQFKQGLNTLAWSDETMQRYAVFVIARKLSERRDVNLTDATEGVAFRAVRDWVNNKTERQLGRILFNDKNTAF